MLQYFEGLYINAIRASIREIDDWKIWQN
jgi:hypothetical protein